ncbi:hypothetical protein [Burkholderia gladioli]|nr:hypothetical protein [Burkholderia gladioli]
MTTTRHIDWRSGAVRIEQARIEVDASGALAPDARAARDHAGRRTA